MDKVKILVVEDESIIAQDLKSALEELNYLVPPTIDTGEKAIQKALEFQPDLVLMDIILRGEMDGIEAAQTIQNCYKIPVVFLSAYSDAKTLQRANATQAYGYLIKPFEERSLNTTIQIALSRHKATVELHSQLAAFVESSDDAVIGETLDGTIVSWNAGAEKIFGYSAPEAIARPILILSPPNCADEIPQILERIARGERLEHYETVRMQKDGQFVDVSLTISPLKDATGKVIGVSEIARDLTKDKRNGRLLQQQRSLLNSLIEGSTDSIVALDLDFRFITFNSTYKTTFLQIADREIEIGSSIIEAIAHLPPEVQAKSVERWRRGLAGEEFTTIENYTHLSGQHDYYEITCSSIRDSQGQLLGASQISKNITDRIRAEQILRESEERFRNAFNYTAVGMAMGHIDGRLFKVNRSFCRMLGYSEAELLTKNFQSITHPDDLDATLSLVQQLLAGEIDYYHQEKRYLHKQGHSVWAILSVSLVRDEQGQPLYFIGQIQDISDRKKAEQALHKSEALLKEAQNLARIGNWEYDVNTQEVTWSEEVFRICGLDSTEFEPNGAGIIQLFHPEDGEIYHQIVQRAIADGTPYDVDLRIYRSDGVLRWLNLRGETALDAQGRVIRLFGTAQDITERKQAEEQLQQAHQKLTFHVQNTPLAVVEWDSQFRVSSWSQRAEEIFGWKAEEVLGKTMDEWRFIFEEDLDYVNQAANLMLGGVIVSCKCDNRNYTKNGSVIDCEWYNSVLLDECGNFVSMLSLVHDVSDRKQAEEALRISKQRLQLALEGSGDAWWDWDIPTQQVFRHPRLLEMLGYEPDELPKEFSTWERLIHPDDKPRVMELLDAHLQDSSVPYKLEHRLLSKSGEWKWIASYARVMLRDEAGKPLRMSGTHRDIDDRKQAEEALRTSEEQLQLVLEGSDEGWWDWNIATGETKYSPRWYTMLGYEPDELPPELSSWERLIHPEDRPGLMNLLDAHLKDSTVPYQLEYRLLTKSGEWKWIDTYGKVVIRDETGKPLRISGTHRDITERKQAEEERAQLLLQIEYERSRLQAVLMQIPAGIWIVEAPSGKLILDNNKVESVLGHPSLILEKIEDLAYFSAIHPDGSPYALEEYPLARSLLAGEAIVNEEMIYRRGDGSLVTLAIYSAPIYDTQGHMIAAAIAAFDITEQKQAQEQIKAALQEKDVLIKEIHDRVKNNLQIVKSLLHLQCQRTKQEEALLVLRDTQNRIVSISLIHDRLYRSQNFARIDFSQYIRELTPHLFSSYRVSASIITARFDLERIHLEIDTAIPCGLIVNELVSNALKYAFPNQCQGEIQLNLHTNSEDTVTLIVRDNGIGLPEEFDLKKTRSLGLTLVQRLVHQIRGTLEVDRSQGTEFRITFSKNGGEYRSR